MTDSEGSAPEARRSGLRAVAHGTAQWRAYAAQHAELSLGFRSIAEFCFGAHFPIAIFWGDHLRLFYNDAYALLLDRRHATAFGQPAHDFGPDKSLGLDSLLLDVLATGNSLHREDFYVLLDRDGRREECYLTFSMSAVVDELGERGVILIVNETTASVLEGRAANERISELTEFLKLADNLADIVYMHSADGTIVWANERWYSFTGLPREASTALGIWSQIMPADDLASYVKTLQLSLPTNAAYEIELNLKPVRAHETTYRLHLIRAKPIFDDDGILLRWAASATDIHDLRIAENEVRLRLERERDRDHRTSLAFQNAAMLKSLPNAPGLIFSAVYEPAEAQALVGGDWYDAFRLSDGRIVLSVGDVMGSGLAAAVTMAGVRQAIRGAAQIYADPGRVLDAADRALRSEQPDGIVTAFMAVIDPISMSLTYASAGHPAPMLRRPNGTIVELLAPDLPLGLRSERRQANPPQETIVVDPGSVLVIYTDGLTEFTHDILDGERRLRDALVEMPSIDSTDIARHVRDTVLTSSNDDVAILTVSFGSPSACGAARTELCTRWSFAIADTAAASCARRGISNALEQLGAAPRQVTDAELIFVELLSNVMKHAQGDAEVILDLGEAPALNVIDNGPGFTFHAGLPHDDMTESGRGLYIISKLARDLNVVPRANGGSHARAVLDVGPLHGRD
jgi:PAS domain S-box-containing protein